ncbi:SRPBCC family protein [Sphingomonas sp.]|uniref:SRPBCC family protein n=1 Tax=Sphingomonas sp. TaxID=28214 RepID=UPI0025F6CCCD|nr:SRPBCC family protein [Sphingomonas sp.]
MSDHEFHAFDDAPPSTSKKLDGQDAATASLIEPKGSAILGRAATINRPSAELYAYWRDFSNLAMFMENVERIDVLDANRSHWVVKAPAGKTVEWDALVTEDIEGQAIAWASAEGADVANSGRVEFADAGPRGTVVNVTINYDPPAGTIGKIIAKMFQREPFIQARRDLRRFKQLMETGEISTNVRNLATLEKEKD